MGSESNSLEFTAAERAVLREKYARLTATEFDAFLDACQRYRLNPLANQIYARLQEATQKNPRAITYMAQIDGLRLLADRTGKYAGNDDPVFAGNEHGPTRATVTVRKLVDSTSCPFAASARWDEYCPQGNAAFMWQRMPFLMLGKCAEALALRKAFPAELSGLYVVEELDQSSVSEHVETKPEAAAPPAQTAPTTPPAAAASVETPRPAALQTPPPPVEPYRLAGATTSSVSAAATTSSPPFAMPIDWPATTPANISAWVGQRLNLAELKVALGLLVAQPQLAQLTWGWELIMTAVAGKYKQVTNGFTTNRDRPFEEQVKEILERIDEDKKAIEAMKGATS